MLKKTKYWYAKEGYLLKGLFLKFLAAMNSQCLNIPIREFIPDKEFRWYRLMIMFLPYHLSRQKQKFS